MSINIKMLSYHIFLERIKFLTSAGICSAVNSIFIRILDLFFYFAQFSLACQCVTIYGLFWFFYLDFF